MSYVYQGHALQFHNQNPELVEDATFDVHLPASFLGSCEWISEETADSLALARHFGCGTLLITMTMNPHWEEIASELQSGQTAADVPTIVAQVFHARLQHCLHLLDNKLGK